MILPAAFVLGFVVGWFRARRRNGNLADKLQYGAAHGIFFTLAALVIALAADWLRMV